ncbi:MAG: hypothetical protein R2712_23725 [Vicinamibacterales bacterium]
MSRADAADASALAAAHDAVREAVATWAWKAWKSVSDDAAGRVSPLRSDEGAGARPRQRGTGRRAPSRGRRAVADAGGALVAGRHLRADETVRPRWPWSAGLLADRLGGPDVAAGRAIDLAIGSRAPSGSLRIVGVVDNAYDGFVEQGAESGTPQLRTDARWLQGRYDLYLLLAAAPQRIVSIGVTTGGDPAALIGALRRVLSRGAHLRRPLDPRSPTSFRARDGEPALLWRDGQHPPVGALALTVSGVFAMLSHLVVRRRNEIGQARAGRREPGRGPAHRPPHRAADGGWHRRQDGCWPPPPQPARRACPFGVGPLIPPPMRAGTGILVLSGLVAAYSTRRAIRTDPMLTMKE